MMATSGQCVFPAETICHILRYSSTRDVRRWRAVSKWFHDITYDASIWRDLYSNSCLPRPPGPSSSQSTEYLEQALVRTEKLAQGWTTKPIRYISHVELQVERTWSVELLGGRWFVECKSRKCFILHDFDASGETHAPQKQAIWEQEQRVAYWDSALIMSKDGQFVLYVLLGEWQLRMATWRLLEFRLDWESGKPSAVTTFDVLPFKTKKSAVYFKSGNSPFLYIQFSSFKLVFDTRTRVFYELPEFRIALDATRYNANIPDPNAYLAHFVVLTSTHVISLYRYVVYCVTLIQAFAVDESSVRDGRGVSYLSHEGFLNSCCFDATLLRNSALDPMTGTVNMRLLHRDCREKTHSVVDLTLPKPSGEDVLPITVAMDEEIVEEITDELWRHNFEGNLYSNCSDAGHLRGLYIKRDEPWIRGIEPDSFAILKFAIDATQDECVLQCGEYIPLEWNHIGFELTSFGVSFDGARGRACFVKSMTCEEEVLVIVDFE